MEGEGSESRRWGLEGGGTVQAREALLPTVNGSGGCRVQCPDLGQEKAQGCLAALSLLHRRYYAELF